MIVAFIASALLNTAPVTQCTLARRACAIDVREQAERHGAPAFALEIVRLQKVRTFPEIKTPFSNPK